MISSNASIPVKGLLFIDFIQCTDVNFLSLQAQRTIDVMTSR
jgi:hypothetical protein